MSSERLEERLRALENSQSHILGSLSSLERSVRSQAISLSALAEAKAEEWRSQAASNNGNGNDRKSDTRSGDASGADGAESLRISALRQSVREMKEKIASQAEEIQSLQCYETGLGGSLGMQQGENFDDRFDGDDDDDDSFFDSSDQGEEIGRILKRHARDIEKVYAYWAAHARHGVQWMTSDRFFKFANHYGLSKFCDRRSLDSIFSDAACDLPPQQKKPAVKGKSNNNNTNNNTNHQGDRGGLVHSNSDTKGVSGSNLIHAAITQFVSSRGRSKRNATIDNINKSINNNSINNKSNINNNNNNNNNNTNNTTNKGRNGYTYGLSRVGFLRVLVSLGDRIYSESDKTYGCDDRIERVRRILVKILVLGTHRQPDIRGNFQY